MRRLARRLLSFAVMLDASAGCAQLAGIDETSGTQPDRVSLEVDRISVGATVSTAPQDLSSLMAQYLVLDDTAADGLTRVPAELTGVNLWTAVLPSAAPPIVAFDLPGVPTVVWQFPNRNLRGAVIAYEHPSPTAADPGASVTVSAALPTPYAAGETFSFLSIGAWVTRVFTPGELPAVGATVLGPNAFAYQSATAFGGGAPQRITTADVVLVLRYLANRLTGVLEATPFDQTTSDMVSGTMTEVAADQQLDVSVMPGSIPPRFAPLEPAMSGVTLSWSLTATPGVDAGVAGGVPLHAGSVLAGDPDSLVVSYGNPFISRGWSTVLLWSASASRTVTPPGETLPMTSSAELATYAVPTTGMMMTLPAALPEVISIDGVALASDDVMIAQPLRPVTISFETGGPEITDAVWIARLYELAPNAALTALQPHLVISAGGATKELLLPPEAFVPGKLYMVRAICYAQGFPALADGDLATRRFPISVGYHDSGAFRVTP